MVIHLLMYMVEDGLKLNDKKEKDAFIERLKIS